MGALKTIVAAIALALIHGSCGGLNTHRAPAITAEVTFAKDRVSSGIASVSVPRGTTVEFVDFVATEENGEARIAFRWRPRMGLPLVLETEDDVTPGGNWRVRALVVYEEHHQSYFNRQKILDSVVPIEWGGKLQFEIGAE